MCVKRLMSMANRASVNSQGCLMIWLTTLLLIGFSYSSAQVRPLGLEEVFEHACVAPFELFFEESETYLRSRDFNIYRNDAFNAFENEHASISGAYSPDPEDPFCKVHSIDADPLAAERVGRALISKYFGEVPTRLTAVGGVSAWAIPYRECCHLVVRVGARTPVDTIGGASLTLFLRDR